MSVDTHLLDPAVCADSFVQHFQFRWGFNRFNLMFKCMFIFDQTVDEGRSETGPAHLAVAVVASAEQPAPRSLARSLAAATAALSSCA